MKKFLFQVAVAIGFLSMANASTADTPMAWDQYYGGNWTSPDCQWRSSQSNQGTTRTLSCYGGDVLNYTYTVSTGVPVYILNSQRYYVTTKWGTGAPNSYNFLVMKKDQQGGVINGFQKPIAVITPGVSFSKTQENTFPFRVLNAPAGAKYQFWESVVGIPDTGTKLTDMQLLPASKKDPQSDMDVTTLYVNTNNLDLRTPRLITLKIFDSTEKQLLAEGNAPIVSVYTAANLQLQQHDALNAFYVNRAGQNVVDYRSGYSTSGKIRAGGSLFNPEIASLRTNTDNHGNPGLKCSRGGTSGCGTFDVTGGWFDAGDQGKYAQNAAVSLWHLFNLIEKDMPFLKTNPRDTSSTANQQRNIWRAHSFNLIPENPNLLMEGSIFNATSANHYELPNIVKEARYEMEWLLKMQINSSYYNLQMDMPLGNQDITYSENSGNDGFGVRAVYTTAHIYNNYTEIGSSIGNSLRDPGSNTEVLLYRQQLKYTNDVNVEGMVFHSVHDDEWTDIPMLPKNNTKKRVVEYPTSAATLSFAAVAAQCYRVFKAIDPDFANRCMNASTKAFNAYKPNGQLVYFYGEYSNAKNAPLASIVKGAGAYADLRLNDLIYWANMERYLTTVDINGQETTEARNYLRNINSLSEAAPFISDKFPAKSASWLLAYNWSNVAALGSISALTVNPERFAKDNVVFINDESSGTTVTITSPAKNLINYVNNTLAPNALANPWGLPVPTGFAFEWGSNHEIINAGILVATAIRLNELDKNINQLTNIVKESTTYAIPQNIFYYMLGSNPLNISMVTGQNRGRSANNIHHRVFAKQKDSSTIDTPAGWLVGGANGQIPQAVLSASRFPFPGELNKGVFNGGAIDNSGGGLGAYQQLFEVLPRCRDSSGKVFSAMCHSNNYWSYHTNEVAINWQASWLWLSSFVRR